MNFLELAKKRKTTFEFSDKIVSDKNIYLLLEAARWAPSCANIQPWHFIVVTDRQVLNTLAQVHPYGKMLNEAPLAILVCGDENIEQQSGYLIQDCSAAVMNILNTANAEGLGSVWLGVYPREERVKDMSQVFNLPTNIIPIALLAIGYADEQKPKPDRFKKERIHYNKW